ncbi:PspA/IM30 family protein [Marinicella meishanensis]|uniref:PspA/IM30 family protein n=1 Tax=Marinicella meishanensis TaxID=2873263 RepID=UPI001CC050B8|nr:PspA/IM30 family protein [Marinicella sp. NBU2979]
MSDDKQDPNKDNKSEGKSDNKAGVGKNILEKIMNVIREDSRALSEAVMDSRGTRIHERQIEVAKDSIKQAKRAITDELAKELQSSRKLKIINERVDQQEQRIIDALSQDDEALAFELATEMVELEQDRDTEAAILRSHELHLGHLTRQMEQTERTLMELERQLAMVQTTADIQKATDVITQSFAKADAKMLSAKRSLERIRRKQQQIDQQYEVDEGWEEPKELPASKKSIADQAKDGAADVLKRIIDKD